MITLNVIEKFAKLQPDKMAIKLGSQHITWEEYANRVHDLSSLLSSLDLPAETNAVFDSKITVDSFIVASALATLQIPWVAVTEGRDDEVKQAQIQAVSPKIIVTEKNDSLCIQVGDDQFFIGDIPFAHSKQLLVQKKPFRAIGFTSGTTGIPKLVLRSTPSEKRRNEYIVDRFGFTSQDVFLLALPLSHASGHGWARTFLSVGATVVVTSGNPNEILSTIETEGVTATLLVPPMLRAVLDCIGSGKNKYNLSTLQFVLTGGRHINAALVTDSVNLLGEILHLYYGTTETGINTFATPDILLQNHRSSGLPLPGTQILILGSENTPLEKERIGRVAISSYMNADGYKNVPLPTVVVDRMRYIVTADSGYVNAEGQLVLCGRTDPTVEASLYGDLIGFEENISNLCGVKNAASYLEIDSGKIIIFLETVDNQGVEQLDVAKILQTAQNNSVKAPVEVALVTNVIYNPTGKLDIVKTTNQIVSTIGLGGAHA